MHLNIFLLSHFIIFLIYLNILYNAIYINERSNERKLTLKNRIRE